MNNLEFPEPWETIETLERRNIFESQLQKELSSGHFLFNQKLTAIGKSGVCDDVLYQMNGNNNYVIVHLTWSNNVNNEESYPRYELFDSLEDVFEQRILPDNKEYFIDN